MKKLYFYYLLFLILIPFTACISAKEYREVSDGDFVGVAYDTTRIPATNLYKVETILMVFTPEGKIKSRKMSLTEYDVPQQDVAYIIEAQRVQVMPFYENLVSQQKTK